MYENSLSISAISFLILSFVLILWYKLKGGRKSGLLYFGDFGKFAFFLGVFLLALRQLMQDIDENENNN